MLQPLFPGAPAASSPAFIFRLQRAIWYRNRSGAKMTLITSGNHLIAKNKRFGESQKKGRPKLAGLEKFLGEDA